MAKKLRKKKKKSIFGIILCIIQIILSIVLFTQASVIPGKYLLVLIIVLFGVFAATFSMQFARKGVRITGKIISIIVSISLVVGIVGLYNVNHFMDSIETEGLKVDNMVVVVRKDDPAENILDTKSYMFGVQETIDKVNTDKMCDEINNVLETKIHKKPYKDMVEMGQGLLNKEVDAIIYNQAFAGVIEEMIQDYSSKVKVIHQFGIETKIEEKEVDVAKGFNIYISGIDVSGPISTTSRSDVNIIMTVNPETKQILLTSTPRDYYVPIPEISGGARDKLTHAGIYGVDASIRTLEQLYGIDISYYAKVNFSSLINIVDVLGGVDVYSEYTFSTDGYDFYEGMNHMDGTMALAFARERYSFASGDNQRGKNQEAVIEGILNKAMSPAILSNASNVIASVSDSVETNMGSDKMKQLINMQLSDGASWEINSQSATGNGDYNSCYSSGSQQLYVMYPDEAVVNECAAWINGVILGE